MKALAGVLLAVALAVGIGDDASAQRCPSNKRDAKHVTRNSVKQRSKLAKVNTKKTSQPFCLCQLTHKKKHHRTGVMKTSTYAGYMPSNDITPTTGVLESDMFPSNPLPVPGGTWDNTGRDLRTYPPQSHVLGDVNATTNPASNSNTNANMNWLESSELKKNQAEQQKNQAEQQKPAELPMPSGKQMPTQQQVPTEQVPAQQQMPTEQMPTEQPKNQ